MTDLIIRIPENQMDHFWGDKYNAPAAFWRFHSRPKQLDEGDFIWFTTPKGVVAGVIVSEITKREIETDDPQGIWKVIWKGEHLVEFDPPVAEINYGSQGYRYAKEHEQDLLRKLFQEIHEGSHEA